MIIPFVLISGLYGVRRLLPSDIPRDFRSYGELHATLNQLIASNGIVHTISTIRLARDSGVIDVNQCHSLLHQVGHSAYEFHPNDWKLLTVLKTHLCMDGYWHGVEAQMAMDWPRDSVRVADTLRRYCDEIRKGDTTTSCYHGAGHAFIQLYQNKLSVALGKCDELVPREDDPNDCYRGVLSEYKNYLMAYDGDNEVPIAGRTPVVIETSHTFDECARLEERYRDACVSQFAGFLVTSDLSKAVATCSSFPLWVHRRCAHTVTTSYISNTFNQLKTLEVPSHMSSYSANARAGVIDGAFEGLTIFRNENFSTVWQSFCLRLTNPEDIRYCTGKLQ